MAGENWFDNLTGVARDVLDLVDRYETVTTPVPQTTVPPVRTPTPPPTTPTSLSAGADIRIVLGVAAVVLLLLLMR